MTLINNNPEVNSKIDELIKSDYGTITSTLTQRLGPEYIIQIDNLVSRSFMDAKSDWSLGTVPCDPRSRIWQFITDNSGDLFCMKISNRNAVQNNIGRNPINLNFPDREEATENNVIMLFACCSSSESLDTRIALILKVLGGYASSDIARVLSKNELSVIDEINNAKINILSKNVPFEMPAKSVIHERLSSVLDVLHSIFEAGFNHPNDKLIVFPELCQTTVNLLKYLTAHPKTNTPKSRALLSYMLLCSSRLPAMKDNKGNLLNLNEQDRSLWDRNMISEGVDYLYSSASGSEVTPYHLKAGIAAIHSTSSDYRSTNWKQIISLYDNYLELNDSPMAELEKAIAVSRAYGPKEGIKYITRINDKIDIGDNVLLPLTLGNLHLQLHEYAKALENLTTAVNLSASCIEKNYINNKINICEQRIKMTKRYNQGLSF